LLTGLGSGVESAVLLVDRGQWISSGNLVDPTRLPAQLLAMVAHGQAARQRVTLDGVPVLAVGLPLTAASGTYVEVFPLRELDRTLHYLSWMLGLGVLASGLAGALLGRWATSRALRPLTTLTEAAAAAAGGDLGVRLPVTTDPDLAPLASAFNETAQSLQDRVIRDARFAANVSHELRSPLTTMINAAAVLRHRQPELSPSAQQALELLDTDLSRFRQMVDDLIEISRDDLDPTAVQFESVDVTELVRNCLLSTPLATPAQLTTVEPHPRAMLDRRRMDRAIANLLLNAEHHGEGVRGIDVSRVGGRVRIFVDDAGPGVAPEDRERIFERFTRGRGGSREHGPTGVGLGLALVSQHVHLHGGRTWVEESPAGGARFVIELAELT
jgi:signal transduction histidine kinase